MTVPLISPTAVTEELGRPWSAKDRRKKVAGLPRPSLNPAAK